MTEEPMEGSSSARRRSKSRKTEDLRTPWIMVGIGAVISAIMLLGNVWTVIQNYESERRQDRLSDCFRRVIVTINVRTEYNEELRAVEARMLEAPGDLVQEIGFDTTAGNQEKAVAKYLNTIKQAKQERLEIIKKQDSYQYPDLHECEQT